jgi:hypothetical protein
MSDDLFVSLQYNKFQQTVKEVERRIDERFAARHEYPIWPQHDGPLDALDRIIHDEVRKQHKETLKLLISVLRALRQII